MDSGAGFRNFEPKKSKNYFSQVRQLVQSLPSFLRNQLKSVKLRIHSSTGEESANVGFFKIFWNTKKLIFSGWFFNKMLKFEFSGRSPGCDNVVREKTRVDFGFLPFDAPLGIESALFLPPSALSYSKPTIKSWRGWSRGQSLYFSNLFLFKILFWIFFLKMNHF